jgi:riboflavin biosynthesis pyrimidine reductase
VASGGPASIPRLETLFDRSEGAAVPLPDGLRAGYGGDLRFAAGRRVFANFVSTIDGLVSYGIPGKDSARVISRAHPGDRFVMGLLRAAADVVVSGAGTLRVESKATWAPQQVFPPAAEVYRELRRALGRPGRVPVAILSMRGEIDLSLPVFHAPDVDPLVVTTVAGAERLAAAAGAGVRVRAVGEPTMRAMLDAVVEETGAQLVLSEAGPNLFGRMLEEGVVDELFLTIAPQIAGRSTERPGVGLVQGTAFTPDAARWCELVSAKRSEDFLLLRYGLGSQVT